MLGAMELVIIGILAIVLLFGSSKVPELARGFGRALGEFKKAKQEVEREIKDAEIKDEKETQ